MYEPVKPELVIGLVGPVGSDVDAAGAEVAKALVPYGYHVTEIRLSRLLREAHGGEHLNEHVPEDVRIERHMDAGDELRRQTGRNDAVAGLAVGYISDFRQRETDGVPVDGQAYVLNSLKHPAEVQMLRRVYGARLILISVHTPASVRGAALQKRIAETRGAPERADGFAGEAEHLMVRDERDEERDFGQNVRATFTSGDVYVASTPEREIASGVQRYLALYFGNPFLTPTREEYAMFHAHAAALRSADLSRQVGAVVATDRGDVIAVGCNEVPRAFGGQYWPEDEDDQRDFELGYDSNAKSKTEALERAFQALWDADQLADGSTLQDFVASLSGTRLANITEFGRPVHAEMAALLDAARRGASVKDHQLVTTTFPCHNCARHMIAAGIREVVYREPYEKSLALSLHRDAIEVDPVEPTGNKMVVRRFVGVGPPRYFDLFTAPNRKDDNGNRLPWSEEAARPRLVVDETAYLTIEEEFLAEFSDAMKDVNLEPKEGP